jgi:hypothetical protein
MRHTVRFSVLASSSRTSSSPASTYCDEWLTLPPDPVTGRVKGAVRSWYLCGPNGCSTLICSKDWDRFNQSNPLATGQRWYCKCGARFMTRWGQVVEVQHHG